MIEVVRSAVVGYQLGQKEFALVTYVAVDKGAAVPAVTIALAPGDIIGEHMPGPATYAFWSAVVFGNRNPE